MTEPSTPAGWYPDPDGSGGQRYWNGRQWTENRLPGAERGGAQAGEKSAPDQTDAPSVPSEAATAVISRARHAAPESSADVEPAPAGGSTPAPGGSWVNKVPVWTWFAGSAALLIAVIAAVALVFMNADTGVNHTPSAIGTSSAAPLAPSSASTSKSAPAQAPGGIGDEVRDGKFTFVVTGVDFASTVTDKDDPTITTYPQGVFAVVHMTVTNVGDQPQTFVASMQKLKAGGTEFSSSDDAEIHLGGIEEDINPGSQFEATVAYDVPVGTQPESIELHESPLSDGVQVKF